MSCAIVHIYLMSLQRKCVTIILLIFARKKNVTYRRNYNLLFDKTYFLKTLYIKSKNIAFMNNNLNYLLYYHVRYLIYMAIFLSYNFTILCNCFTMYLASRMFPSSLYRYLSHICGSEQTNH